MAATAELKKKLTIGVDIGGTRTKIGLVDADAGSVLDIVISPTETKDARKFIGNIARAVQKFKTGNIELKGIGIGVPGFCFAGGVVDSTYGFLEFMEDYPLAEIIQDKLKLPCRIDNDARVVALGEARYGKGKDYNRVLVLTLGTGLGVGFTIAGQLDQPLPYAHMAGHLKISDKGGDCYCGKTGCLEALVSATGLNAAANHLKWSDKYPDIPVSPENILKELTRNNPEAVSLINNYLNHLKIGIDNYINLLAPDMIILGGGVAKGLEPYIERLADTALLRPYKHYKAVISVSALQEKAGILGAAALLTQF